jgi:hypothetical protein
MVRSLFVTPHVRGNYEGRDRDTLAAIAAETG